MRLAHSGDNLEEPMPTPTPPLHSQSLVKRFGDVTALNDVSLQSQRGRDSRAGPERRGQNHS